jgi:hypothetical protein
MPALTPVLAGYLADTYIGAVSVFWLMLMAHRSFSGAPTRSSPLYGRGLAGGVARKRHGPRLWRRQFR